MRTRLGNISLRRILQSLTSVALVFALTLVMLFIGAPTLGQGVIALLYLVPIGWCTLRWGQIAGVSAALTAALSFDFLFIPPYGTFTIGSLEGWLLLFLFIGATILVIGRIQSTLSEWQNRERNATFLYEIVVAMASQANLEGIAQVIANQIQQRYMAKIVRVYLYDLGKFPALLMFAPKGPENLAKGNPDCVLPIVSDTTLIGEITIWKGSIALPQEDEPMVQTLLRQVAVAIDRAPIAQENALETVRS